MVISTPAVWQDRGHGGCPPMGGVQWCAAPPLPHSPESPAPAPSPHPYSRRPRWPSATPTVDVGRRHDVEVVRLVVPGEGDARIADRDAGHRRRLPGVAVLGPQLELAV